MSGNKLIRTLYRSLFKLAQKFDRNVPAKSLLYRPPQSSADSSFRSDCQLHFNSIVDKILGRQRLFYHPSRLDQSLRAIVRKEFRNRKSKVNLSSRVDVGFSLYRQLTLIFANYQQEVQCRDGESNYVENEVVVETSSTMKKKRKKSSKSKLDVAAAPVTVQEGVILAAHPMIHGDLHRSLILIVQHNENCTFGVVLNKADTQHSVRTGVSGHSLDGFFEAFGDNHLFKGGNVRRLCHMHRVSECGGATIANCKTKTPLFMHGSIHKAIEYVKENKSENAASSFYFFAGECYWEAGQVQSQVQEGIWLPVVAPVDELLDAALESCKKPSCGESTKKSSTQSMEDDSMKEDRTMDRDLERQNVVWTATLDSASRNFSQLSKVPHTLHAAHVAPLVWTSDDNQSW